MYPFYCDKIVVNLILNLFDEDFASKEVSQVSYVYHNTSCKMD